MSHSMPFSLVTTCRNEIASLPRWKENILAQTRQPDEIVVVDAFSDDGTAELLADWAKADSRIVLIQEKGAAAHGRNVAIQRAKHEYVLSTDMGVRLAPVWCQELMAPFEKDASVEIVAGNTCIDKETVNSEVARAEYSMENGGEPRLGRGFVPGNRSVAYTKKVWRELGGLPEDLTFYADDSVFGRQMVDGGYKMAYAPRAMTYWGRPNNLRAFWKEQFNYGRGDGEAMIKVPCAYRWHEKGWLPKFLVPYMTAIRFFQKRCRPAVLWRVLKDGGASALFMLPLLTLGQGYAFGTGFLIGERRGRTECRECRARVAALQ